jgi:hypothetical protein
MLAEAIRIADATAGRGPAPRSSPNLLHRSEVEVAEVLRALA